MKKSIILSFFLALSVMVSNAFAKKSTINKNTKVSFWKKSVKKNIFKQQEDKPQVANCTISGSFEYQDDEGWCCQSITVSFSGSTCAAAGAAMDNWKTIVQSGGGMLFQY